MLLPAHHLKLLRLALHPGFCAVQIKKTVGFLSKGYVFSLKVNIHGRFEANPMWGKRVASMTHDTLSFTSKSHLDCFAFCVYSCTKRKSTLKETYESRACLQSSEGGVLCEAQSGRSAGLGSERWAACSVAQGDNIVCPRRQAPHAHMCCQAHRFFLRQHGLGAPSGWASAHWYVPRTVAFGPSILAPRGCAIDARHVCQAGCHPATRFKRAFLVDQVCGVIPFSLCNGPG